MAITLTVALLEIWRDLLICKQTHRIFQKAEPTKLPFTKQHVPDCIAASQFALQKQ